MVHTTHVFLMIVLTLPFGTRYYILFFNDDVPMTQYLTIKILESSNATGIAQSFNGTFSRFGIAFTDKHIGIYIDWASTKVGNYHGFGIGAKLNKISLWLHITHFFYHCVKCASKIALKTTAYESSRISWCFWKIITKTKEMIVSLKLWRPYLKTIITHLESLDSQTLNCIEFEGFSINGFIWMS